MLSDVGKYLWSLVNHWAAFMTGGVPALLVLIVERWSGRPLSSDAFVTFLAFGLVAAAYRAHRKLGDELNIARLATDGLRTELKVATDQLADTRRLLADANNSRPAGPPRTSSTVRPSPRQVINISNMRADDTRGVVIYKEGNTGDLNINGLEANRTEGIVLNLPDPTETPK